MSLLISSCASAIAVALSFMPSLFVFKSFLSVSKSMPCWLAISCIALSRSIPASTKSCTCFLTPSSKPVLTSTASCTSPIDIPSVVATLFIAASNVPPSPSTSAIALIIGAKAASNSG